MWTEEIVTQIVEWSRNGLSANKIVAELSERGVVVTKNAVIGKLSRLRDSGIDLPKRHCNSRGSTIPNLPRVRIRTYKPKPKLKPILVPPPAVDLEPMKNLRIYEMTRNNQCRYGVDEDDQGHIFCGRFTMRGPWCAEHEKKVFTAEFLAAA